MAELGVLNAFNQARQLSQQEGLGQLQQAGALMGILSQVQQQQQRQQALAQQMAEHAYLANPETQARLAKGDIAGVLSGAPGMNLERVQKLGELNVKQSTADNTKEMAKARLLETARMNDSLISHRISQEKNDAARLVLEAERDKMRNYFNQKNLELGGEKLFYETGARVNTAPAGQPQGGIPFNFGPGMTGTVPDEAAAVSLWKKLGAPGTPSEAPAAIQPASPAVPTPDSPMPQVSPAAPNNLDARDLGAWSRGPVMGSTPTAAPQTAPAQPSSPAMPQFTGSPKEQAAARNKWLAEQAAAGQFGNKETVRQVTKSLEENYTRLRDAPQALANIEKAKELIPAAKLFQGSLGEQKLAVAKFFNNNLGSSINLEGVKSAEELRSRIFFNIMDNLKKMDAQPSQLQQQIMQEALGKLGTDPSALGNILDAFGDVIRDKVASYDTQMSEAEKVGVKWPHKISITAKKASAAAQPSGLDAAVKAAGWAYEPDKYEYRITNGKVQRKAK